MPSNWILKRACVCVWVPAHMWVRRCTTTTAHRNLLLWIHSRKLRKAIQAKWYKATVSMRRHSIQPVLSLVLIDGEVFVLFSKRVGDTTGHKIPLPPSKMQIHHHHDECHHLCHFNSTYLLCPMPSPLHMRQYSHTRPLNHPFKAGAAAGGETCVPAEWISFFSSSLLLHNLISLQASAKVSMKRGTGSRGERGNRLKAIYNLRLEEGNHTRGKQP